MSRSPLVLDTSTANQRQLRGRSVDFGRGVETNNAILSFWRLCTTEICRVFPPKVPVSHSKVTSSRSNCCRKKCTNDQVRDLRPSQRYYMQYFCRTYAATISSRGFFFRYELNFDKVAVISDALATVLLSTLLLFVRSLFWLQRYMG